MNRKKRKQTSKAMLGIILLAAISLYGCGEKESGTANSTDAVGQNASAECAEAMSDASEAGEGPLVAYSENEDGTWSAKGNTYKYRKVLTGRMPQAEKDTTFIVLSNVETVSFQNAMDDMLSSNSSDHFDEEETIIVEMQ